MAVFELALSRMGNRVETDGRSFAIAKRYPQVPEHVPKQR